MNRHAIQFLVVALASLGFLNGLRAQGPERTATITVLQSLGLRSPDSLMERIRLHNEKIGERSLTRNGKERALMLSDDLDDDRTIYFSLLYLSYYGLSDYGLANAKAFLEHQQPDGFIAATGTTRPVTPFLAQIVLLGAKQANHYTWLKEKPGGEGPSYYERLKHYLDYWWTHRDADGNGLPAWNMMPAAGMTPPSYSPQAEKEMRVESIALACYLYREFKAMIRLAHQLHHQEDKDAYQQKAKALADSINAYFWDEQDGFYYDRDEATGNLIRVKAVTGFLALFAGVAPYARADRLVHDHLRKEDEFQTAYPIPIYGPAGGQQESTPDSDEKKIVWLPANYMIFQGLMDYGYRDVAKELSKKTFDLVFQANAMPRMYYDAATGQGFGPVASRGWTALAYLLPWECELNYSPSTLSWQPLIQLVPDYLNVELNPN